MKNDSRAIEPVEIADGFRADSVLHFVIDDDALHLWRYTEPH